MIAIPLSRTLCALLLISANSDAQDTVPQFGKDPVSVVVKAMTLEEKAKFVVGNGFSMPGMKTEVTAVGVTKDNVPGAAGTTFAIAG